MSTKKPSIRSFHAGWLPALFVLVNGCALDVASPGHEASPVVAVEAAELRSAPMLNLSHIECMENGDVWAHFVLLFAGSGQPGMLSGTYNGGSFGPVASDKNTGNVWHYDVYLPSGELEIFSATTTTSDGEVVELHNPGEYSGTYECGDVDECPVAVEAYDFCAVPLTSVGAECALFGLLPQGRDNFLNHASFPASQDAYVALVKSKNKELCAIGEASYRVYVDVSAGDILYPAGDVIFQVAYCACPTDVPPKDPHTY